MNQPINLKSPLTTVALPLLIVVVMVFLAQSAFMVQHPTALSFGITFDLLLTMPLVYFLLIRKQRIPNLTVVPLFIAGLVIASFVLPAENQYFLHLAKTWLLPLVEGTALLLVAFKVRAAIKRHKKQQAKESDFFTVLKDASAQLLPGKAAVILASEIAMFYYGFLHWKKHPLQQNEFSYHRDSGAVALLAALLFIIAVETAVVHVLLHSWSPTVAWVLSVLSLYSILQLFGCLRSMSKRPIAVAGNLLHLRYGIMSEATIPLSDIAAVEVSSKEIEPSKEVRKLSPLGQLDSHNLIIHLKQQHFLQGPYGVARPFKTVALHVDEKEAFKLYLESAMEKPA